MKYIPLLLSLLLVGCSAQQPQASFRQISMDQAVTMMAEEENYIILDVRRADEFAAGHIPGAVNIPNESIGTEEIPHVAQQPKIWVPYRVGQGLHPLGILGEKAVIFGHGHHVSGGSIVSYLPHSGG